MADQTATEKRIVIRDQRTNRPKNGINRTNNSHEISCKLNPNTTFRGLMKKLEEIIGNKDFVVTFMDRTPLELETFNDITNGTHLWILNDYKQKLQEMVKTPTSFPPHYNTITESGMYEYYSSRGIDSLVISLAELIDNSLAATKLNRSLRHIEIRYYDNNKDSMVLILDNGHGMTGIQLQDWARFKYSKFVRKNRTTTEETQLDTSGTSEYFSSSDLPLRPNNFGPKIPDPKQRKPGMRYLDSEINYFGAGGKQAVFNIGDTVTMVSKNAVNDIVELTLSKKKFEEKSQQDLDSVYKDSISSRSKGNVRTIPYDAQTSELILDQVIRDIEDEYNSFTICAIKDVSDEHRNQFCKNVENETFWPKGLARIYHYYLHGPKGNVCQQFGKVLPPELKDINIFIKIFSVTKTATIVETPLKQTIELKNITDDFETQLVKKAKDKFEFEVEHSHKPGVVIEGIIRYYPYLYDRETIPQINQKGELCETVSQNSTDTNQTLDEYELIGGNSLRNRREVFECFWHGRLIPQDMIDFEWNKFNPKIQNIKEFEECYNRLSGALFTNCAFRVSQNKQSFMDLSKFMAQKDCLSFYRIINNKRQTLRINFDNEFIVWLKDCHRKYDKQVLYKQYSGVVSRNDFPVHRKCMYSGVEEYSVFNSIDWRDKEWSKGLTVLTKNIRPKELICSINRFLVPKCRLGPKGTYMGPPGLIEVYQIPDEVYGKGSDALKIISFREINVDATQLIISENLNKIIDKLPDSVEITFPVNSETPPITHNCQMIVGSPIPHIQVNFRNSNLDRLTTDRIPFKANTKTIGVVLKIDEINVNNGTEVLTLAVDYPVAKLTKKNGYWFRLNETGIKKPGNYRLTAECIITSEPPIKTFPNEKPLPKAVPIEFSVIAGPSIELISADKDMKTYIGKPFVLKFDFLDKFKNLSEPDSSIEKPVLSMENFRISFKKYEIIENQLLIKNIIISGILNQTTKTTIDVRVSTFPKVEVDITLQKVTPQKSTKRPIRQPFVRPTPENGPTATKRPMISSINSNTEPIVNNQRRQSSRRPLSSTPVATSSQISNGINSQSDANTTVETDNEEGRPDPNYSTTILEPIPQPLRYESPSSDSDEELECPEDREQNAYDPVYDLLALKRISFNDLELKPTQTDTSDPLIRHYETKIFNSLNIDWMVCAMIETKQNSIGQTMERVFSYKIVFKSELKEPILINYVFINASFRDIKFYPDIHETEFNKLCTESPFHKIELMDANNCNNLFKQKDIRFRLIIFQIEH